MYPMSASPTPAMEPRSPALGTTFWIHPPQNESATLTMPMTTITAMPMCQALMAASSGEYPSFFRAMKAGPSTVRASPMVEGVSRPRGIAVMSCLPVFFASRKAIQV